MGANLAPRIASIRAVTRRFSVRSCPSEVFAVNHLAPFLLTNLLLGTLTAAGPARVITVTSDAHTAARLDLDDLQLEHGWQSWRAYANSKLANILFTRELARRLEGSAVTANCAHPGLVRTRFGRFLRRRGGLLPFSRAAAFPPRYRISAGCVIMVTGSDWAHGLVRLARGERSWLLASGRIRQDQWIRTARPRSWRENSIT